MLGKKQLTIIVIRVPVVQNVWFADILELCILGLDALGQLSATVDTVSRQLFQSQSMLELNPLYYIFFAYVKEGRIY